MDDELESLMKLEIPEDSPQFKPDQADVFREYHEGSGRVCVGAGAGTGKTTTLTRVLAEAVLREYEQNPDQNPFRTIFVTTFTRDAAGELKTDIKSVLRDHEQATNERLDQEIWRWIETDSNISTIDSFIMDILREIAAEVSVNPDFEISDELEKQDIVRHVFQEIEESNDFDEELEILDRVGWNDIESKVYDAHQNLREFCDDFSCLNEVFENQIKDDLHQGHDHPLTSEAIADIVESITCDSINSNQLDEEEIDAINDDYQFNIEFFKAFGNLLEEFEKRYDEYSRKEGLLSYRDVTYLVWKYLKTEKGKSFSESLQNRFTHVFIDEFQDTNFAQSQILSNLIPEEESESKLMIIGDVKQSIYAWRSANPEIFSDILQHADNHDNADPHLGVKGWTLKQLQSNFRSHPHLVQAANNIFSEIFDDPGRGDIGSNNINYTPLNPQRTEIDPDDPHIHIIPLGDVNADGWRGIEPNEVAAAIKGVIEGEEIQVIDREKNDPLEKDPEKRAVKAGDFTLLFCRSRYFSDFREALDRHGIQNAVIADEGLFQQKEINFIIDVLDWFANPHSKDSLLRILRSPVTALEDKTIRFVMSKKYDIATAIEEWDEDLPSGDLQRLEILLGLRSDLRWDREGSKAELVQRIIQHTGIETILLSGSDARQRYGNLWTLVEVIRDWEEDELIPYREFVDRLREYQQLAERSTGNFEKAQVADRESKDTVKLRTVHSAKGLEFNIVVLADLLSEPVGPPWRDDLLKYGEGEERELVLRPREATDPISFDQGPGSNWISTQFGARSTLWISDNRRGGPDLAHPHPYNTAVEDFYAEYWRLLYVAFTRAADHLILPLGDNIHFFKRWNSWGYALNRYLQGENNWSGEEEIREVFDEDSENPDGNSSLPLGVGTLPSGQEIDDNKIGLPSSSELSDSSNVDNWEGIEFAPRNLNPSSLYDLVACPLRYQYRTLQSVSESRAEAPPGSDPPSGLNPSGWGKVVHKALDQFHKDYRKSKIEDEDGKLYFYLDNLSDPIAKRVSSIIEKYKDTPTWSEVQNSDEILPEYELSAQYNGRYETGIRGRIDLLYTIDGDWKIVDFKTGEPPRENSSLDKQYQWQLTTYAWLLREKYGINPQSMKILYVTEGIEKEREIRPDQFEEKINELPENLEIISGQGLPQDPSPDPEEASLEDLELDTLCGSCPYKIICPAWKE